MTTPGNYDGHRQVTFTVPRAGSTVKLLIIVTCVTYVVQFLLYAFWEFQIQSYLGVRADRVVERFWVWQVFTYMFLHSVGSAWHLVFNMLVVYWAGSELELLLGRRRFLTLYFGGGIAGGLAYCITQYLAGSHVPAIGASAAVMALLVVFAIHFPNRLVYVFFLVPVRVKHLVMIIIGIDLLHSMGPRFTGVAHTAHLGGALYGYLFWRFSPTIRRFFDGFEDRRRERDAQRRMEAEDRENELLDKISRDGFDSLSAREREFLLQRSRDRQDRGYRR